MSELWISRDGTKSIMYRHRDRDTLSIWEAARIMRDLGTRRFNYRLRDAVKDGAFAYAKGDWGTFYDDMQCLLSECGADDQAAVDTEERFY